MHKKESVMYALEGIKGIENDNYAWSMHCVEWLIQDVPDNWAVWCYAGEVYYQYGLTEEAQMFFRKSMEIASSKWAKGHVF